MTYKKTFTYLAAVTLTLSLIFGWMAYETPRFASAATDVLNDADLGANLTHFWELEESTGDRVDSFDGIDLVESNSVTQDTSGIQGSAAFFASGHSEKLTNTGIGMTSGDNPFSVSFWFKSTSTVTGTMLSMGRTDTGNRWYLYVPLTNTGAVNAEFAYVNGSNRTINANSASTGYNDGNWHLVVINVYNSGSDAKMELYIDNATVVTGTGTGFTYSMPTQFTRYTLGSLYNWSSGAFQTYYTGAVDEAGFFDGETFTSSEVAEFYNSGSGVPFDAGGGGGGGAEPPQPPLMFSGYDIIGCFGQSNTFAGEPEVGETLPNSIDATSSKVFQWGRYNGNDGLVIPAVEPLDHKQQIPNRVGWCLTLARKYERDFLAEGRAVLIVPAGEGGTGFNNGRWNKGQINYSDAMSRTLASIQTDEGCTTTCDNELVGIFWHQGESDSDNATEATAHESALLTMIDDMRTDLSSTTLPFIAGGMVPDYVVTQPYYPIVQSHLENVPTNRNYTGYADPEGLSASSIYVSPNHFSSWSVRGTSTQDLGNTATMGLAGRYWDAYIEALQNTPNPTYTPTEEIWYDSDGLGCTKVTTLNGVINVEITSCP